MRLIGCGLLALTFASSGGAAERYVEVWNPPEARPSGARAADAHAGATRHAATAKPAPAPAPAPSAKHKHHAAHAVKARTQHRPAVATVLPAAPVTPPAAAPAAQPAPGKLTVMQPPAADAPRRALDYTDIPRQFTPDGNVLRVGTRNGPAEVTR
ncbi:conserved exported protein of unknown function [Burkholderia multivorans]